MAARKAKRGGAKTGRIVRRRVQSPRRATASAHTAAVRRQIDDALSQGRKLRAAIEARIDKELKAAGVIPKGRRRRARRS